MRWVFPLPGVTFGAPWQFGRATFRPAGEVDSEVRALARQRERQDAWATAHEVALNVVAKWNGSATVETEADDVANAQTQISEAVAVLRFLLREIVPANIEAHRIGLTGEVGRSVRDYVAFFDNEFIAPGWKLMDDRVPFEFSHATLSDWKSDERIHWLSDEAALSEDSRSLSGRRLLSAVRILDRAFLVADPVVQVALYAIAIEVLLANDRDETGQTTDHVSTAQLRLAGRAAFLTCDARCATEREACPYVLGFKGKKELWATVQKWATAGEEWRCSAFLDIARPPDMNRQFKRLSVFGARNEAVHEGRTSLSERDRRWLWNDAENVVRAFLEWAASHPGSTISDLDDEILAGAARLGTMTPKATK